MRDTRTEENLLDANEVPADARYAIDSALNKVSAPIRPVGDGR
jgi:hypothetical protein